MKTIKVFLTAATFALIACGSPTSSGGGGGGGAGHDGSSVSPKALTIGTSATGKIGSYNDLDNSESYYSFNTGSETAVVVSITASNPAHAGSLDYDLRLYDDGVFGNQIELVSPNDHIAPYFAGLAAGTTHTLKLLNKVSSATTYTIRVDRLSDLTLSEGTTSTPIDLGTGGATTITHALSVSGKTGNDISYYRFHTNSAGTVTISYPEGVLDGTLYSQNDWDFADEEGGENLNSSKTFSCSVTDNTDYWLSVQDFDTSFEPGLIRGNLTITINP